MKLFKYLIIISIIICFSIFVVYSKKNNSSLDPISHQNNFYQDLNLALKTSQLKTSSFEIRDFNNEIEFFILDNNPQTKVIISTQKNPFWQISSLQEIIKTAKIKQQGLKLVDLSSVHPYATFKNN